MNDSRYYAPYPDGLLKCRPGGKTYPSKCDFHGKHHYCDTCEGFYGVPHDGIHEGDNAHPVPGRAKDCVCRPCQKYMAAI